MANFKNDYALGTLQMPVAQGAEIIAVHMVYAFAAAPALNDVAELGFLPAGHVPVDCIVDSDELDTGTNTITVEVGILNSGLTAIDTTASGGAAWTGSDIVAQGGGISRATGVAITRVPEAEHVDQALGLVVTTGPNVGAAGSVGLTLMYRATHLGS